MKWIGWIMALICAVAFAVIWQTKATELDQERASRQERIDALRARADDLVNAASTRAEQRQRRLGELQTETAQLKAQKDALDARKLALTERAKALAGKNEELRGKHETAQGAKIESTEEVRELQERIGMATLDIAYWNRMMQMVRPSEGGR